MHTLTISNLNPAVVEQLSAEARRQGKSASELAGELIERAVAPIQSERQPTSKPRDIGHLAGTWTREEADEFDRAVATFGQVDEELWK